MTTPAGGKLEISGGADRRGALGAMAGGGTVRAVGDESPLDDLTGAGALLARLGGGGGGTVDLPIAELGGLGRRGAGGIPIMVRGLPAAEGLFF